MKNPTLKRVLPVLLLALAAAALAACGALPNAAESGSAKLSGTINKLDRSALPENGEVQIDLLEGQAPGMPDVVVQSETLSVGRSQVPLPWEMSYDPAKIDPAKTYYVGARILVDGQIQYANAQAVPVITNGAPTENIEIMVSPYVGESTVPEGGAATLSGTVNKLDRSALAPNAVIDVQLFDASIADAPATLIATQTINADGQQLPIPYALTFDRAMIDPGRIYQVGARITVDGQLQYINDTAIPVLTGGAPTDNVEIMVVPTGGAVPPSEPVEGGAALTGQVTFALPTSWAADSAAYLQVEIREPMLADAPAVATTQVPLAGLAFPVPFSLPYDPATIDPAKAYVADARIIDNNQMTFSAQGGVPVLTNGAPSENVDVPVFAGVTTGPAPIEPAPAPTGGMGTGGGVIAGTITTDAPAPLDPNASLIIDLREAGTTGAPMVSISQLLGGAQFPLSFEVPYAPAGIDPNKDYVIGARILLGDQVLYASPAGVPVLTKGAPTTGVAVNIPPQ